MYGIYANIGGILMGSMLPYIAYMDPMGESSELQNHLESMFNDIPVNDSMKSSHQVKSTRSGLWT